VVAREPLVCVAPPAARFEPGTLVGAAPGDWPALGSAGLNGGASASAELLGLLRVHPNKLLPFWHPELQHTSTTSRTQPNVVRMAQRTFTMTQGADRRQKPATTTSLSSMGRRHPHP
jgi:hypothetical protein